MAKDKDDGGTIDVEALIRQDAATLPEEGPRGAELSRITQLGRRMLEIDDEVEDLQEQVKELKVERLRIAGKDLPDMFDGIGVEEILLANTDSRLVCSTWVRASIPKGKEAAAFEWLIETDNDGIIKTVVTAQMDRGDLKRAQKLVKDMARDYDVEAAMAMGVHPQTLGAFVREHLNKEKDDPDKLDIPMEILGAATGRVVDVKKRKKSKS